MPGWTEGARAVGALLPGVSGPGPAWLAGLSWVDLVVVVLLVASVAGALRRRAGLLGALGSALGALLVCWLAAAAVTAWGPPEVRAAVEASGFVRLVPVPTDAALALGHWLQRVRP